jgi:hypothetical protein
MVLQTPASASPRQSLRKYSTRLPKRVRARRNNRPLIGVFRDADGDGAVNIGDPVYLINYVFKSGPPPVEPCCP